jgi:two-component system LytT family response regulator
MTTETIRVIAIDDEQPQLSALLSMLEAVPGIQVVASATDPHLGLREILRQLPDLILLDISMPGMNAFDILNELRKHKGYNPEVVFVTAWNEFAIRAFEYAVFDYLLKPIDPVRLETTLTRFRSKQRESFHQRSSILLDTLKKLVFYTLSGVVFIDPSLVVYVEADGNYSIFYFGQGKKETVTANLGKVEDQLDPSFFYRVHRSYLINTSFLKKIITSKAVCILNKNGEELTCPIARDRIGELTTRMKTR